MPVAVVADRMTIQRVSKAAAEIAQRKAKDQHRNVSAKPAATLEKALKQARSAIIAEALECPGFTVHEPTGTMITPTTVQSSIQTEEVQYAVILAVKQVVDDADGPQCLNGKKLTTKDVDRMVTRLTRKAMNRLVVELGKSNMVRCPGTHFTFIDSRNHNDCAAMVKDAREIVALFRKGGVDQKKIVISIPATEAGVAAARVLKSDYGIQINLTLVCGGIQHVAICHEAGAAVLSIPVGPALAWYERKLKDEFVDLHTHPGIQMIQSTLAYFKVHDVRTKIVGTHFRGMSEISPLGGLDAVSLSIEQLDELRWCTLPLSLSIPESSPVIIQARKARFPTSFLQRQSGFMSAMSAETSSMVAGTMYPILGRLKVQMELIEDVIQDALEREISLRYMEMKHLVRSWKESSAEATDFDQRKRDATPAGAEEVLPENLDENKGRKTEEKDSYVKKRTRSTLGVIEGVDYF